MISLIAGPWIGEFGWELMGWQGVLRMMAPYYKHITVYGPVGHLYLYEDFIDKYVEYTPEGNAPNMWMNGDATIDIDKIDGLTEWIRPQQFTLMPNAPRQDFIKYGVLDAVDGYDIVCHARSIDKYGSDYINTPLELWASILEKFSGLKIASIGTKSGADHIPGTVDCRGIPLNELADLLRNSRVLIGPSSGPMHYGALCGTPLVVWSGYARSRERYETRWNPIKSPAVVIDANDDPWGNKTAWQPESGDVVKAVKKLLEVKSERNSEVKYKA